MPGLGYRLPGTGRQRRTDNEHEATIGPLPPWQKVTATFAGAGTEDNWNVVFAYADLGHEPGTTLAVRLQYPYPHQLERNIRTYLHHVKAG